MTDPQSGMTLTEADRTWVENLVDRKIKDRLESALEGVFERTRAMDVSLRYSEQSMKEASNNFKETLVRFDDVSLTIAERYGVLQATSEDHSNRIKAIDDSLKEMQDTLQEERAHFINAAGEIRAIQTAIYGDPTKVNGPASIWGTVNELGNGQKKIMDSLEHIQVALREQAQQRAMWRRVGKAVFQFITGDLFKKILLALAGAGGLGVVGARIIELLASGK